MSNCVENCGLKTKGESIPSNVRNPDNTAKTKRNCDESSIQRDYLRPAHEHADAAKITSDPNHAPPLVDLHLVIAGKKGGTSDQSSGVESVEFSCSLKTSASSEDPRERSSTVGRLPQGCQEHPLPESTSSKDPLTVACNRSDEHTSFEPSIPGSYRGPPVSECFHWMKDDKCEATRKEYWKILSERRAIENESRQPGASNPGRTFELSDTREHSPLDRVADLHVTYNRMNRQRYHAGIRSTNIRSPLRDADGSDLTAPSVHSPVRRRRE